MDTEKQSSVEKLTEEDYRRARELGCFVPYVFLFFLSLGICILF